MIEENIDVQTQLQQLSNKAAHIEQMLGRGNKTVVMQFGSHSLKYGIANDPSPRAIRCLVAHKIKSQEENSSIPVEGEIDAKRVGEIAKQIEAFLTKKGNIKHGDQASQKIGKQPKSGKSDSGKEKLDLGPKPSDFTKSYYVGDEVYYFEGRKDYRIREPIQFGLLNTDKDYTEIDAIRDLELLVLYALEQMEIDQHSLDEYSVVICAPDKFHRGQFKLIIDMLLDQVGFGSFSIHLESILASFGCGLSLACIVDIGYTTTTITTVEEGIIVANSQIRKHLGTRDIDALLLTILDSRDLILTLPEGSKLSNKSFKHMAAIEKIRERLGLLLTDGDFGKSIEMNLSAELNEPAKITVTFNPAFVVAPALHFHAAEMFDQLNKGQAFKNRYQLDRNSDYFRLYVDEEDFHDDTEASVNKMMAQCLINQDQSKKQQILEQSKIDVGRIQAEFNSDNLEDIISYSIFQLKDADTRKKAANSIVITGGFSNTPFLIEELEDRLIERIAFFDPNIDSVAVIDLSNQESDSSSLAWVGGSIMTKLDCMRDGFVTRNRWFGRISPEEIGDRRQKKDCAEFGIKYLKEKISFQW